MALEGHAVWVLKQEAVSQHSVLPTHCVAAADTARLCSAPCLRSVQMVQVACPKQQGPCACQVLRCPPPQSWHLVATWTVGRCSAAAVTRWQRPVQWQRCPGTCCHPTWRACPCQGLQGSRQTTSRLWLRRHLNSGTTQLRLRDMLPFDAASFKHTAHHQRVQQAHAPRQSQQLCILTVLFCPGVTASVAAAGICG